jgi:hypothetical protein
VPVCLATEYYPLVLVPCGHGCCDTCAPNLEKCPLCQAAIASTAPNVALIQAFGMDIKKRDAPSKPLFAFRDGAFYVVLEPKGSVLTCRLAVARVNKDVTTLTWKRLSYYYRQEIHGAQFHDGFIQNKESMPVPPVDLPTRNAQHFSDASCKIGEIVYFGHYTYGQDISIAAFPVPKKRYAVRVRGKDVASAITFSDVTSFVVDA